MGLGLIFWTRIHRFHENKLVPTNGGPTFLKLFGWTVVTIATVGILLEGIGGLIATGNFFHQLAHETMYGSFLISGFSALLERTHRLPSDSWRVALVVAFIVEGIAFYGHQLEQEPVEAMLHLIMFATSIITALLFLWSSREPTALLPHVAAVSGMIVKGLWFYVVANILYGGAYGVNGRDFMVAASFTYFGIVVCSVVSFMGLVFLGESQEQDQNGKYAAVTARAPEEDSEAGN
jgi:hypothetical protein